MERLKPKKGVEIPDMDTVLKNQIDQYIAETAPRDIPLYNQNQPFGGQQGYPTLTQENLIFLDGLEEGIPDRIREITWGLLTPQNQLTQISSSFEQARIEAGIRCGIQTLAWEYDLTPSELTQIMLIIRRGLLKSRDGRERRLLAPQLSESRVTETILQESPRQNSLLGKLIGKGD